MRARTLTALGRALEAVVSRDTEARPRASGESAALLKGILDEIAETMLPRRLEFVAEGGRSLVLIAADRLLLMVEAVQPESLGLGAGTLAAFNSAAGANRARPLAELLLRFAAPGGDLVLRSTRPDPTAELPGEGLAVEEIEAACRSMPEAGTKSAKTGARAGNPAEAAKQAASAAEAPPPEAPADPEAERKARAARPAPKAAGTQIRDFLAGAGVLFRAAELSDDKGVPLESLGQEPLVPIGDLARGCRSLLNGTAGYLDALLPGPRLLLFATHEPGAPSLVCATGGADILIGSYDDADQPALLEAWDRSGGKG